MIEVEQKEQGMGVGVVGGFSIVCSYPRLGIFFVRSRSNGLDKGSYVMLWFWICYNFEFCPESLYSEKGVRP